MPPAGSPYASPYISQKALNPHPKVEDVEDDQQSTLSHATGPPRAAHALDALRLVAGNRVRHGNCAPEFLEEIATKGVQNCLKESSSMKFKIVNGSEARTFFKNYLRDHNKDLERTDNDKARNETLPPPIVFAVTVFEPGKKCVDYYMTWRGKAKSHRRKEYVAFLESEFRRLVKGLDNEYQQISSLRTVANLSQSRRTSSSEKKPRSAHSSRKSPAAIPEVTAEERMPVLDATLPPPPSSATDSVMSLPLLNMMRNVPFSHRVHLRVTNPDRLSIISDLHITSEEVKDINTKSHASHLSAPSESRPSKRDRGDSVVHDSSASIRSSDTGSSISSRSSGLSSQSGNASSSSHGDRHKDLHNSSRSKDFEAPEFLIVFLGDKLETDTGSWHGLARQTSIRTPPTERHSPWIGSVAYSESMSARSSPTDSPDTSDAEEEVSEVGWKGTPVVPMKPLMEVMGLIPKAAYYSPPVVPGGLHYQLSVNAGSPMPNQSPYLYSSPQLEKSPYISPWITQLPMSSNSSRPISRSYSLSTPYASPYMQNHTNPF